MCMSEILKLIAGNVMKIFQFLDLLLNANCGFSLVTDMTHCQRIHVCVCTADYSFIRMERQSYVSDIS